MVVSVVVDASVLVASFLDTDEHHPKALEYIRGLETDEYAFHLPRLALIETLAAINRRARRNQQVYVLRAKRSFDQWSADDKIAFYDLEEARTERAVGVAIKGRLNGADAVYAALAEELGIGLKTFDRELSERFRGPVAP